MLMAVKGILEGEHCFAGLLLYGSSFTTRRSRDDTSRPLRTDLVTWPGIQKARFLGTLVVLRSRLSVSPRMMIFVAFASKKKKLRRAGEPVGIKFAPYLQKRTETLGARAEEQ